MNLLGSRTRTRTQGAGTFRCPREQATRRYDAKVVQRWFSIGSLPVIRRDEIGSFVECNSCASTFDVGVLSAAAQGPVEDMLTRALRRAASALLAPAELSDDDRREAVIVLQRYANVPYGSQDLNRDLSRANPEHLDAELRALALALNDEGRTAILDAGVQLASPQGRTDGLRLAALQRVAEQLAIPEERVLAVTGADALEPAL